MTAARPPRKRYLYFGVLPLLLGIALAGMSPPASRAVTTERVVVDRHTGLALYGVDPVGYFTDGKPVPGLADFEYGYAGAIWRFHNEGNRAAFAANPDVYMPRYGGYDPVGISRGLATPGFPALWVVFDQRLYLFYTTEARDAFAANAEDLIATADSKWREVRLTLAP